MISYVSRTPGCQLITHYAVPLLCRTSGDVKLSPRYEVSPCLPSQDHFSRANRRLRGRETMDVSRGRRNVRISVKHRAPSRTCCRHTIHKHVGVRRDSKLQMSYSCILFVFSLPTITTHSQQSPCPDSQRRLTLVYVHVCMRACAHVRVYACVCVFACAS